MSQLLDAGQVVDDSDPWGNGHDPMPEVVQVQESTGLEARVEGTLVDRTVRHRDAVDACTLVRRSWLDRHCDTDHQQEGVPPMAEYTGYGTVAMVVLEGDMAAPSVVAAMVGLKPEHGHEQIDDEGPLW